ncbi:vacuolar proton translocating ATPase 116 kDa subunit a 1 [Anopheles darlingi]|uniref:V-type proton ATPase subunit a n=1 Tax=Anopheles darlingi TaxID=43151 RepID=W5JM02_ANODA|nr:vacuolar proton translocating ATPase 116 kDa subunit a 1 [Anopheles darlingi]
MGAMFRSEEMSMVQLLIQPEAAYQSVAELGELGIAQFRDLNADINMFQRKYTSEIRRCEEMERKIGYIRREINKDSVTIPDMPEVIPRTPNSREIIDLEAQLEKTENEIVELSENNHALLQNFMELTELKNVLEKTQVFFSDRSNVQNLEATGGEAANDGKPLGFVAGVISRERIIGFERMLWRVSRGNIFLRQAVLEEALVDPKTGDSIHKIVFVAFFQGEQLKSRVKKVCTGYHASLYPCPNESSEREEMLRGVRTRIEDLKMVLGQTQDQRQRVLLNVAKEVPTWEIIVKKVKAMNIFGSSWSINYNTSTVMENKELQLNPTTDYSETVYWYGLDPLWMLATNKIIFLNSFKMKLSIIFGVVHMIFGVSMSVVNHRHFHRLENVLLEFIPQMLFLVLLFAYMCFMMFFKWIVYSAVTDEDHLKPGCAPSVLIMFINMMLFKNQEPLETCKEYMFDGQDTLQVIFIVLGLICIPWLLLAKPLYIMVQRKKKGTEHVAESAHQSSSNHHDDEPMSEIFIHQAIHTIEYILSTISHTASYLRLWALSLAHAQLSEVLYNMVFTIGLSNDSYVGAILIWLVFWPWSVLTIGILVGMEGLSAFLHTLRLHWVEFMSKFYDGLGYAFKPFSFKAILEEEECRLLQLASHDTLIITVVTKTMMTMMMMMMMMATNL